MQVKNVSFTSAQPYEQKESTLYTKRGYMSQLRGAQFVEGFLATYGILETVDKFVLVNKKDVTKEALKKTAKSHTKYNLLFGLVGGIASVLIGKYFTDKYTLPFAEKYYDKLVKYEEINNKTKEIIKEAREAGNEKKQKSEIEEKPVEIKAENKEKTELKENNTEEKVSEKKIEENKVESEQKD